MKIMALWMTLGYLEGGNTKRNHKDRDGESLVKKIKYRQPFVLQFCYCSQVDYHNNRCNYRILMDSTWDTKFWKYQHFAWYLSVMEANTALASGNFQNGGNIMPNLDFQEQLALQ